MFEEFRTIYRSMSRTSGQHIIVILSVIAYVFKNRMLQCSNYISTQQCNSENFYEKNENQDKKSRSPSRSHYL